MPWVWKAENTQNAAWPDGYFCPFSGSVHSNPHPPVNTHNQTHTCMIRKLRKSRTTILTWMRPGFGAFPGLNLTIQPKFLDCLT
jgi:hypothetical protein